MVLQKIANNLLGGVGIADRPGAVNSGVGENLESGKEIFKTYFGVLDGDAAFNTAAEVAAIVQAQSAGGDFELLWERTIPAQQRVRWGFGSTAFEATMGRLHFVAMDVAADFQEMAIRLVVSNSLGLKSRVVAEFPTQRTHLTDPTTLITATPVDKNTMEPLPMKKPWVREDSKIQIWGKTISEGTTIDVVDFQIPASIEQ